MDAKQRAVIDLVLNGQQAQTSLRDVTKAVTTLRREINGMKKDDNPALYKERVAEMNKMLAIQQKMRSEINGTASAWQKTISQVGSITTGILGGTAVQGVMNTFTQAKTKVLEYKDSLADVSKATDMSTQEAQDLNEQLQEIKTRTPTKELRELATVAGQFGTPKQQIDEFTESADKLNIALGDEFNGAEDLAKNVLTMRNIFTDIKSAKIDDDMLHIGNALNFLSSEGAATAPVMADFASRIGGTLIPLGLSSAKVLGYAATLQELNVTAERGSTALVNVFQKMLTETDTFAKVAGVPLKEYKDLINKDINAAFLKYVQGLQKVSGNQTEFMAVLEKSKLTGAGEMEVLSKLSTNMSLLGERTNQAGSALTSTDSILAEFSKRNHQLAQDLKTLDETFDNIYQSQAVQDFVGAAVHKTVELIQVLPKAYQWLKDNGTIVGTFVYALAMMNVGLIKATLASWANTTAVLANRAAFFASYQLLVLQTAITGGYSTVVGLLTGRIALATVAQRIWNVALSLNPIGLVITAVAGLAYAIKTYSENTAEAIELERKKSTMQHMSKLATEQNARSIKELNERVSHYNELSKKEQEETKKLIALKETEARVRLANAYARAREIARKEAKPTFGQGVMQGATDFVTGNWGNLYGSGLDKRKGQQEAANKAAAYENAKLKAETDQLKTQWDEIKQLRENLDKPVVKIPNGNGNNPLGDDKAAKQANNLEKMLADTRQRIFEAEGKDYEKKVAAATEHYDKMYKLAGSNAEKIKEITRLKVIEMAALQKEHDKEEREKEEKRLKESLDDQEKAMELKKKTAFYTIDQDVAGGSKSQSEGDAEKLRYEQQYYAAKELLVRAYYKTLEDLNKGSADRLKQIESDKKTALLEISTQLAKAQIDQAQLKRETVDKALQNDLEDLEQKRDAELLKQQQRGKKGLMTEKELQVAELKTQEDFLQKKRQLLENYYDILAKMGLLSAEQLKNIEREKNKALLSIDGELVQAQQQQYEGKLGDIKKFLDTNEQYMNQAADALKVLFAVDQKKLDVGPLVTELDALQQKTNKTNSEQERMKTLVSQIAQAMPEAVSGTDAYGNAIAINTDLAKQEVEQQKKRADVMRKIMIAQQLWAAADATVQFGSALMRIWSTSGNPWAAIGYTALATLTYTAALAKIKSQSYDMPQFAEGGSTAMDNSGQPEGWVKKPTQFNLGKRSYIAGEAGQEYIISYPMLKNPAVANLVPALEAIRTGRLGISMATGDQMMASSTLTNNSQSGISPEIGMAILAELRQNRLAMENYANRPIKNNYFELEKTMKEVEGIKTVTSL